MEFSQYTSIIAMGFVVWLTIAVGTSVSRNSERFLAYMAALLFCLIGTSEIMMIKPIAFFFTVGGVFAFCYIVARAIPIVRMKK